MQILIKTIYLKVKNNDILVYKSNYTEENYLKKKMATFWLDIATCMLVKHYLFE